VYVLDSRDRPLRDLRVSVTDRCNLRCAYCMPREVYGPDFAFLPRSQILSFGETTRVVAAAARLGVRKVRITGGEPLLRRDLERLVERLAAVPGVEDLAMTTNGLLLERRAHTLAAAGLSRVNISLDALDDATLAAVTGARVPAARVLAAIDAARTAGLAPVKVNMVVRRGVNDGCVAAMAARFRHSPVVVRFIEYMDVGSTNGWSPREVVSAAEIVDVISERWPLRALDPAPGGEVASRYAYRDGAGEIGIVHSVSKPFCGACSRARLSADGKLFTCLFSSRGHDLRALLRAGASDAELEQSLRAVWGARTDRYSELRGRSGSRATARDQAGGRAGAPRKLEMSYIGG
jgi:cyclic pyranopterin phosphate synthase